MARYKNISANLNAFLDALAWSEGVIKPNHPLTKDDGYDVIVTGLDGSEIFTDYKAHPFSRGRKPKQINRAGLFSTASGRYQFMLRDYEHYRNSLGLIDFGPVSQDKWAIQLLRERKALALIEIGQIKEAVSLCRNLWASLPGAGYGQHENDIAAFITVYQNQGGFLWDLKQLSAELLPQSSHVLQPLPQEALKPEPKPMPTIQPEMQPKPQNWISNLIGKLLKRN